MTPTRTITAAEAAAAALGNRPALEASALGKAMDEIQLAIGKGELETRFVIEHGCVASLEQRLRDLGYVVHTDTDKVFLGKDANITTVRLGWHPA